MDHQSRLDLGRIAQDLQIRKGQVETVVRLLEEGHTAPYITHYKRLQTGALREEAVRGIQRRLLQHRQFTERKESILKGLQLQGKLTESLAEAVKNADNPHHLDDLYLPFKPKKPTAATEARERGLEPAALAIWNKDPAVANLPDLLPTLINPDKGLPGVAEVEVGVKHILAELIAEHARLRHALRRVLWETGRLTSCKVDGAPEKQASEYKEFHQFSEPLRSVSAQRILGMIRGEREKVLSVKLEWDTEKAAQAVAEQLPLADHPHADFLRTILDETLQNVVLPSLQQEIRRDLMDRAEDHAATVLARMLRRMFLQPGLGKTRVLAIDPGLRNGCRLAALDENGKLLAHLSVNPFGQSAPRREERKSRKKQEETAPSAHPPLAKTNQEGASCASPSEEAGLAAAAPLSAAGSTPPCAVPPSTPSPESAAAAPPQPSSEASAPAAAAPDAVPPPLVPSPPPRRQEAKERIKELVERHRLAVVALGNGPGCREMEQLLCEMIAEGLDLAYHVVQEVGASQYGGSVLGREELPDQDAGVRAAVSLGRRLQDPLSEFAKLDPQTFNQLALADIGPRRLRETVETMLESSINLVGADLNAAPATILQRIAGLNALTARRIVERRTEKGPFKCREELREVAGITDAVFEQASGFLKIVGGEQPFDATWLHPSSYPLAGALLERVGHSPASLADPVLHADMMSKLRVINLHEAAAALQSSPAALDEIIDILAWPGRDVREDFPKPLLKRGHLQMESLQPGQELRGTVLNVVDFGAFVDVGLKESGLVHISQLANRYIKSPHDVVTVGDVVRVWVLKVDLEKGRVSLTMIPPGADRKAAEKGAEPAAAAARPPRPTRPPQAAPRPRPEAATPPAAARPAPASRPPRREQKGPPAGRRPAGASSSYHSPKRDRPLPKLSQEALEGKKDLRTFAELKAFFEAKKPDDEPAPSPSPSETADTSAPPVPTVSPPVDAPPAEPSSPPVSDPVLAQSHAAADGPA